MSNLANLKNNFLKNFYIGDTAISQYIIFILIYDLLNKIIKALVAFPSINSLFDLRPDSQVVRHESAKLLCEGSIPSQASF